jgi:hypothetical protein
LASADHATDITACLVGTIGQPDCEQAIGWNAVNGEQVAIVPVGEPAAHQYANLTPWHIGESNTAHRLTGSLVVSMPWNARERKI